MTDLETSYTARVDEFLESHGPFLPVLFVDFALDMRSAIADLEAALEAALEDVKVPV